MRKSKTSRDLTFCIVTILITAICMSVSTFAIAYAMVSVEGNFFTTGTVQINLNDGQPVIRQGEFLTEPGITVKKDFFIENQSTCEVYYKLYFENISGELADVLEVTVCDGDKVLLEGKPSELTRDAVAAFDEALAIGEKKTLQIYFYFPKDAQNSAQGTSLSFDLAADAVQTKNNPDKSFD